MTIRNTITTSAVTDQPEPSTEGLPPVYDWSKAETESLKDLVERLKAQREIKEKAHSTAEKK